MRRASLVGIVCLLAGCRAVPSRSDPPRTSFSPALASAGVVFVANGAGDSRSASDNLAKVVAETHTPLLVEVVPWSRGSGRYVIDQLDGNNHQVHGRALAAQVYAYRQMNSGGRVCLVGHSAGCAVVLTAAGSLPPDSIDRIVLLAPSVCTSYDLRPALRASREGIDSFHSERDRWVLGLGMRVFGTTEEGCRVAAGRVGFVPVMGSPTDEMQYTRLRQHPWNPAVTWTGNDGGHFGTFQPEFLRAYVLPLLACPAGNQSSSFSRMSASISAGCFR